MSEREHWILILAYHFPPENAVGGLRPYRFYKFLPEHGYRCHVITAADVTSRPDLNATYVPDPFFASERRGLFWQFERIVRKLLLPGTVGVSWSSLAYCAALRFVAEHTHADVTVFSTWPPLGPHLAAWRVSKRLRRPWIADFRDPLAGNPAYARLGRHTHLFYSFLERAFLKTADVFIANTDEAEAVLKRKYPRQTEKIDLIWNGFDPDEAINAIPLPTRSFHLSSHVGELYEGRTVAPLIESLARLVASGRLAPASFQIRLVGPASAACLPSRTIVEAATASGWLKIEPELVPKQLALRIAQESDSLLLIQPHSKVQVPGKLFEYLQMSRRILALVPRGSAIERLLTNSGITYRAIYDDLENAEFDEGVLSFFTNTGTPSHANDWFRRNFDARLQTSRLAELIRDCNSPRSK